MSFTNDPQENLEIVDQLDDMIGKDTLPEELTILKSLKDENTPIFNGIVDEWEEVEKDYGNDN